MDELTFIITGILESIERKEAADLIQRYDGKVTQSVSKKTSYDVVSGILERANFPRYIVIHSSKEGEKNHGHKHISKLTRNENFTSWRVEIN